MDFILEFIKYALDTNPVVIPMTGLTGILVWLAKIAVAQAIKDRTQKREARERIALAQTQAFNAHVQECTERALTHARLEGKMDGITGMLTERQSRVDTVFELMTEHATQDSVWQQKVEKHLGLTA